MNIDERCQGQERRHPAKASVTFVTLRGIERAWWSIAPDLAAGLANIDKLWFYRDSRFRTLGNGWWSDE